ncbi:hypothetical protein FRC12_010951 [Ceratobasidium sp. 428]|nr:hypothetical protein FRC12_010951 [Ceratobasidium sp. 428]
MPKLILEVVMYVPAKRVLLALNAALLFRPIPRKRARVLESGAAASTSVAKVPTKRPRQTRKGRVDGFLMLLPIEIFSEILGWSHPGDLLALSRTNKSFRRVLIQRSSQFMWRRAENNLAEMGLPECPPHTNEPSYAALLFTKNCTVSSLKLRGLRLPIGPQKSRFGLVNYCFLEDARRIDVKRAELEASGNVVLMEDWVCAQYEAMDDRFVHGVKLYDFLRKWQSDEKAEAIISERKNAIKKRAIEQSIPDVDGFDNIHRSVYVLWKTIVEQPKPLTEHRWKTLKPIIAEILEESEFCHFEEEDVTRQRICSERLSELLSQTASEYMPLKPIAKALGTDAVPTSAPAASTDRMYQFVLSPHPNSADALKWDCLKLFKCANYGRHQTDEIFGQRLETISTEIENWRTKVMTELGQMVSTSDTRRKKNGNDVRLVVSTYFQITVRALLLF